MNNLKVYAALHDDIAEGLVWLKQENLPARCIVKIKAKGGSIYCEALQFEQNFLKLYNRNGRKAITDPTASVVMNHWYRTRLGGLETQKDYPLAVTKALPLWGKLRACTGHPQVVVRSPHV